MKRPFHSARPDKGFTLVELLVVIAIIAVLVALSSFGYLRMRKAGDAATTVAVMRQLHTANESYAADHNGQYVAQVSYDEDDPGSYGKNWYSNATYLAHLTGDFSDVNAGKTKTSSVPESVLDPIVLRAKQRLWNTLPASYGYNVIGMPSHSAENPDKAFRRSQVKDPARTASFLTATDWVISYNSRFLWESSPVEGKTTNQKLAYRHNGKAIVVYYDGHTGTVSPTEIREFDKKGGIQHPFWRAN